MNRIEDLLLLGGVAAAMTVADCQQAVCAQSGRKIKTSGERPNIVLIMVDDMGYSDIECYGGMIPTPNLNRLAASGVRYTQFYNTARSCPTRASLMTGLYPHQAGIGEMTEDPGTEKPADEESLEGAVGYLKSLNHNCVTMAEVLRSAGYHTYMAGKWHLGFYDQSKWPLQRGFDRFYGILAGATSYLKPQGGRSLYLDNTKLDPPAQPYYTTDAFTDHAIEFMASRNDNQPYFLYLAYNAPHWPLQAKQEDIALFKGKFDSGWQACREEHFNNMVELGIVESKWQLAEWENRQWSELTDQERAASAQRMEVYAAQIYCMDYNVGRVLDYIEQSGEADNTLVIFLSDNGACAEPYSETGFGTVADINNPDSWVKPSYGKPWAQVSNTPLRKYKVRAYEGGISTPMILSWPAKYERYNNQWRDNVAFLPDLMATFVDVSGADYPTMVNGKSIHPMQGVSLCETVVDRKCEIHDYIYGEHFDNRYIRHGKWKAVYDQEGKRWELYDIKADRTECNDLSTKQPEMTAELAERWQQWADSHCVYPKPPKKSGNH